MKGVSNGTAASHRPSSEDLVKGGVGSGAAPGGLLPRSKSTGWQWPANGSASSLSELPGPVRAADLGPAARRRRPGARQGGTGVWDDAARRAGFRGCQEPGIHGFHPVQLHGEVERDAGSAGAMWIGHPICRWKPGASLAGTGLSQALRLVRRPRGGATGRMPTLTPSCSLTSSAALRSGVVSAGPKMLGRAARGGSQHRPIMSDQAVPGVSCDASLLGEPGNCKMGGQRLRGEGCLFGVLTAGSTHLT